MAGVRVLIDRSDARRDTVPVLLHTEVHPSWREMRADVSDDDTAELPAQTDRASAHTASAWALSALSSARKAADDWESLAEFARPVPTEPAGIWCEMVAARDLRALTGGVA